MRSRVSKTLRLLVRSATDVSYIRLETLREAVLCAPEGLAQNLNI